MKPEQLEQEIQAAIDYAHNVAAEKGAEAKETAVAWDIVEELQAEASHQKVTHKTEFEHYCDDNPDAAEARVFDE
jgi:uncharacterized protein (DUF433 family)